MPLIWEALDAERVSVEITHRGQTFLVWVNPNDLTETLGEEIQAAIKALDAEVEAAVNPDAPARSKYDPLLVRVAREWEIAETRADDEARKFWPVDEAHAARLPLNLKRLVFWLMIGKLFNPDPEALAASSPAGSGGPDSTTAPAADGPTSGMPSSPPATEASTPAS